MIRWLFAVLVLSVTWTARADVLAVTACNEADFNRVLAQARSGDVIAFACSGTISITETKAITQDLALIVDGQQVILDGGYSTRIFWIDARATVAISGVTLQHGGGDTGGSGIHNMGRLALSRSILTGNAHAIANSGTLRIDQTAFSHNTGVGIYNSGDLVVTGSTFTGNTHGIDNASGTLTVANSTFYGNVFNLEDGIGAGIANSGSVTVINSTFVDNHAHAGGAIGTHRGGRVTLLNTLLVGADDSSACFGTMTDGGHNLQYPGTSCGESIASADPLLSEELSASGLGVFVPANGSPAIRAGDSAACASELVNALDQRGTFRLTPLDPTCEIGAVERAS